MARKDREMKCPQCDSMNTYVKDSRPKEDFTMINRRHECRNCGHRFTTYEIYKTKYDDLEDEYIKNTDKIRKLMRLVIEVMQ